VVDLTPHVQAGKTYLLRIFVRAFKDGRPVAPHWAEWCEWVARGIFRDAYLRIYPDVFISDAFVTTSVASNSLTYDVWVTNTSRNDRTVTLGGELSSWNGDAWRYPNNSRHVILSESASEESRLAIRLEVLRSAACPLCLPVLADRPGATGQAGGQARSSTQHGVCTDNYPVIPETTVRVPASETVKVTVGPLAWTPGPASYWWPNVPYRHGYRARLHVLHLSLREGTEPAHTARVRFGFRDIKQAGKYYELNGVRINFRGDNLQVANYDRIDHGGRGDAIDTLPGFLPPSAENPGWPKAVDNFLRLNYNVQRQHMGPWTPYMLDVCDEMGLMLIAESACRWNGFDMENGRGFHEVKCLQDIVKRDRNHPSIVRWSAKNEPQSLDPDYHVELYRAIKAHDDTRPISEDIVVAAWNGLDADKVFARLKDRDDFTWIEHYLSYDEQGRPHFTLTRHNDAVIPLPDRPYGLGEADWLRSSTPAGLAWFATTIALVRAQGASDVRPYVLLSSWASSIPGVKTTDFLTEENRHPVYGEDNLPDPWSHPGIRLLQKACHPLLALDVEFWKINRDPATGHFPVTAPAMPANSAVTREITVFNDELASAEIELRWEVREGNPSNRPFAQGAVAWSIAPGFMQTVPITFSTPIFNTFVFLTLTVKKDGVERFRDDLTCFEVTGGVDFKPELSHQLSAVSGQLQSV
jgi:hypothetical protein